MYMVHVIWMLDRQEPGILSYNTIPLCIGYQISIAIFYDVFIILKTKSRKPFDRRLKRSWP